MAERPFLAVQLRNLHSGYLPFIHVSILEEAAKGEYWLTRDGIRARLCSGNYAARIYSGCEAKKRREVPYIRD